MEFNPFTGIAIALCFVQAAWCRHGPLLNGIKYAEHSTATRDCYRSRPTIKFLISDYYGLHMLLFPCYLHRKYVLGDSITTGEYWIWKSGRSQIFFMFLLLPMSSISIKIFTRSQNTFVLQDWKVSILRSVSFQALLVTLSKGKVSWNINSSLIKCTKHLLPSWCSVLCLLSLPLLNMVMSTVQEDIVTYKSKSKL